MNNYLDADELKEMGSRLKSFAMAIRTEVEAIDEALDEEVIEERKIELALGELLKVAVCLEVESAVWR